MHINVYLQNKLHRITLKSGMQTEGPVSHLEAPQNDHKCEKGGKRRKRRKKEENKNDQISITVERR